MLSKNKQKQIQALNRKKIRDKNAEFLIEGDKMVLEAIRAGYKIKTLIANDLFLSENQMEISDQSNELISVTDQELRQISLLQNPQNVLAIVQLPNIAEFTITESMPLAIGLDKIQDPGNMGTIIRLSDWFGIRHIFCNTGTVDCYNPKVVQATMGAIFRVQIHYVNFESFLPEIQKFKLPVYGTFLEGKNIYQEELQDRGILILGNEGNGIDQSTENLISHKLHIPSFSTSQHSESLNVATATAICCSEFKRRQL